MYQYDHYDRQIIQERTKQFRDQTNRYLAGQLTEAEFLPLRLQNGLYVQRLAPMLRIAVPYGMLSSKKLRKLAHITREYDKGFAHITTRQNIHLNWPKLEEVPDILEELAEVEMHSVQTSGNCVRNTTADHYSGSAQDEIEDARPWCEIIRQWSTFHPEFAFLPRKFKIAVCGSKEDRSAVFIHDIGLIITKDADGNTGFRVLVGGGLGRTPILAVPIREFLPWEHLLTYLEAILRVYNQLGRRDNKFKARIKILVKSMGTEAFAEKVEETWQHIKNNALTLTEKEVNRVKSYFSTMPYEALDELAVNQQLAQEKNADERFARWVQHNVAPHKVPGYSIVNLSFKPTGVAPGDITDKQLDAVADLADRFSFGEVRTTHRQNLVFADVKKTDLKELWDTLVKLRIATPNLNYITDIICCPGGDYCSLANAKSIPIAESIQRRFEDLDYMYDLGEIELNISGCMNACGHHHIGNIGILGVDKKGEEFYQVSLGGDSSENAAIGKILGPSFSQDEIADVVEKIIQVYIDNRIADESFVNVINRLGLDPFKERVYE